MKIKSTIISLLLFAGLFFLPGYVMANQNDLPISDTILIHQYNEQAFHFYYYSNLDSCKYYALLAFKLSDNLLQTPVIKNNEALLNRCKILKARSLTNYARAIENKLVQAAEDTLKAAIELVKETGNKREEAAIYSALGTIHDFNAENDLSIE
ncbi:MAG: hypothetical protein IH594_16635, partial [Bacteroidales bacterium]|nr:hypothetical protein [Bacteroidales bacterium]